MDTVTPAANAGVNRANRTRRFGAAFLAASPLVLLLGGAVLWRGLHSGGTKAGKNALVPFASAQAIAPGELRALNAERFQADRTEAYQAAQTLVRQFLLSPAEDARVRFPAHLASRSVFVEKRGPALFRVRAVVEWMAPNHALPITRRFEADLRHGPADMKWHLVDTEFLPGSASVAP